MDANFNQDDFERTLPIGMVYHGTDTDRGASILGNGIQAVPNAYTGGELGAGFYTTTDLDIARLYAEGRSNDTGKPAQVLGFNPNAALGITILPNWNGDLNQFIPLYDFFMLQGDDNQIKFNYHNANNILGQGVVIP